MYDMPTPGMALGFTLRWPWLKNQGVFQTGGLSSRIYTEYWYDEKART